MPSVYRIWLALIGLAFFVSCSEQNTNIPIPTELHGRTMGTSYSVKYFTELDISPNELKQKIDEALIDVNNKMSTYQADSELSLFNQDKSLQPYALSHDTAYVMQRSLELAFMTQGALDVTVGPLVNLWGFGPDAKPDKIPTAKMVADTKKYVGVDKLSLVGQTATKMHPNLYVDLSAIAKGFGVDKLAELLLKKGISDFIVEIGGEMRLHGAKPSGDAWRIAIEKPVSGQRDVQQVIEPGNNALATSGDYRNYFEQDGIRYSHTIDPKTAKPINHKLASVSVIAEDCTTADGLATAINVMGPIKGLEFAKKHNLAVYLVVKSTDGFDVQFTESFKPYMR